MPEATLLPAGRVMATVSGEQLAFARRIYNPEPPRRLIEALSPTQRLIAHCAYSRHHDGHVRQRSCERIVRSAEAWVPPYVVQLVGEYVVEIIETIRAELHLDDGPAPLNVVYGTFVAGNPELLELTRRRAVSYWDCYHRSRYSRDAYPAVAVLASLERAASLARLASS
ncbi:MAG TPA: hypothetical protein VG165_06570 [Solirubrobacteraceae bacterium]|nr:hypothetical protein [Solirubrobacteraceae bacterium]